MYVEVLAKPGIEEVQICCVPTSLHPADPDRDAVRIVVVFTTGEDATIALSFARALCADSGARIWLVCPVTRTLLGRYRLERFIRYAQQCAHALPANASNCLRFLACPFSAGQDPVERLSSAHAVVLVRNRWWRSWGRDVGNAMVLRTKGVSLFL